MRFLAAGSPHRALGFDATLNHVHRATTRAAQPTPLVALACDHRVQLEQIADAVGAAHDRIAAVKVLAVRAAARGASGRAGSGGLLAIG